MLTGTSRAPNEGHGRPMAKPAARPISMRDGSDMPRGCRVMSAMSRYRFANAAPSGVSSHSRASPATASMSAVLL